MQAERVAVGVRGKNAWWHTPLSRMSPWNSTPWERSRSRSASTSGTWKAMGSPLRRNSWPKAVGSMIASVRLPAWNSMPGIEPHCLRRGSSSTSP